MLVFRCSIAIPTAMLFTLRRTTLPHPTQNSLPVLRLTTYRVDVSCPLCEAPFRAHYLTPTHAVTLHEENAGSPTVDASLLCCMNGSFRHRRAHTSSPLTSICVLTSAQATASSLGYVGLSMLNSHPYSHAVYASQDYVTASHAKLASGVAAHNLPGGRLLSTM